jgi:hypothetical protein
MMMTAPAMRLNAVVPPPPVALPQPVPPEKPAPAPAKEEKPADKEAKSETKTPAKDEKPAAAKEAKSETKPAAAEEKPKAKEPPQVRPVPAVAALPAGAFPAAGFAGQLRPFDPAARFGDSFNGIKLLDEKGQGCPIMGVSTRAEAAPAGPVRITYELTFAPKKEQATPAKLVFSGSKKVTVEVPFTLKDVPLK